MKLVPKGKLITIQEIRAILADRHGATIGCPLDDGHFRLDRRPSGGRGSQGQADRRHAVLANAQVRRLLEREVSRRSRPKKRSSRPRGTMVIERGTSSLWPITSDVPRPPRR